MSRLTCAFLLTVVSCCALVALAQETKDLKPGLLGEYFDIGEAVEDYPSVDDKKPTKTIVDKQINWDMTTESLGESGLSEKFYVRWNGFLRVPKDGKYTLYLESDDGSRLAVNGKEVVNNGGLHAMEEKSGEVEVKKGDHPIKLELFENEGEVGLKLSWETEGADKQIVPATALFHEEPKKRAS
jgi:hypothetical protein